MIVVWSIVLLVILYLALIAYDAKHDVENAPRADMFLCDKHGAIPTKHLFMMSGLSEKPIPQCPFCFNEKFKEARKNFK